jgi:hypothetical protein|nr:MAG TPA: hypothetical protein [Caudoviricetes sp.]
MKKIMFNDKFGLTEAVLNGKKTMTRRLCKYDIPNENYEIVFPVFEPEEYDDDGNITSKLDRAFGWRDKEGNFTGWNIPKYRIGEVVAVAQCYHSFYNDECDPRMFPSGAGWLNKMFVKPELMPHQIQITDIFIQKLQDISDEDCLKEGINEATRDFPWYWYEYNNKKFIFNEPRQAFASLIDKVYVNGTWEENLYVFGYEFKLIK